MLATSVEFDKLALLLVRGCVREPEGKTRDLSSTAHFDEVFAQNYGELFELVVEVARVNGFLPSGDTDAILSRVESVGARLQMAAVNTGA